MSSATDSPTTAGPAAPEQDRSRRHRGGSPGRRRSRPGNRLGPAQLRQGPLPGQLRPQPDPPVAGSPSRRRGTGRRVHGQAHRLLPDHVRPHHRTRRHDPGRVPQGPGGPGRLRHEDPARIRRPGPFPRATTAGPWPCWAPSTRASARCCPPTSPSASRSPSRFSAPRSRSRNTCPAAPPAPSRRSC